MLGTDDLYQESGYVAMSRGRAGNTIYVVDPEPDPEAHGPAPEPQDPLERLSRDLEASRAQRLAIEALDPRSLASSLQTLYRERASVNARDREGRAYAESLDRLIAGQLNGLVEARTIDPPAYVVNELGTLPDAMSGQTWWRRGIRAIESYRCSNDVTDPDPALGAMPKDVDHLRDWQDARRQVWDSARTLRSLEYVKELQSVERAPSPERPMPRPAASLGPDLGLGL